MALIDVSGIIPPTVSSEIIGVAAIESAALKLGRKVPMPTGVSQMPVQASVPVAKWLTSAGGRKQYTDLGFDMLTMTAEEIAAIIAIPQTYLDDTSINLWNFVKPQLASAFALAVDNAVLFGTNAPATFPVGGITSATYCQPAASGIDAVDTVNAAMSLVEGQGLPVTGHDADISTKGLFRGVRDTYGALLLGQTQVENQQLDSLYGVPINWGQFPSGEAVTFVTGDWDALTIGVRQDIRYDLDSSGVIADAAGAVVVSAFQDDVVLMRAYARYGCLVVKPPTQKVPAGGKPFASATVLTAAA